MFYMGVGPHDAIELDRVAILVGVDGRAMSRTAIGRVCSGRHIYLYLVTPQSMR